MKKKIWLKIGLFWGLGLLMFLSLLYAVFLGEQISTKQLVLDILIYILAGLGFGLFIYRFATKKSKG